MCSLLSAQCSGAVEGGEFKTQDSDSRGTLAADPKQRLLQAPMIITCNVLSAHCSGTVKGGEPKTQDSDSGGTPAADPK